MKSVPILFLIALVVIQSHFAHARSNEKKTLAKLEKSWTAAVRDIDMSGVSVAIVKDGEMIYSNGFGHRTVSPDRPFTANTSSYIASITKTFVGTGIMMLVEEGKVELDAPVKQYLERFTLIDEELAERITIRDLLCHRYGLSNSIITFAEAYSGVWDDDFYFDLMDQTGSSDQWRYTNLHFTILGRVIQSVTGQLWQDYLRDHLFGPLGMSRSTAYASVAEAYDDVAIPLVREKGVWKAGPMKKADSTMHAAGGIYASAVDLAQWIKLFLNAGIVDGTKILEPETVNQMLTREVASDTSYWRFQRDEMGLAWYLGKYKDELLVHHFGGYIGFHAHLSYMPEHDLGVVVLANNGDGHSILVHKMATDVYDAFLDMRDEDDMARILRRIKNMDEKQATEHSPLSSEPLTLSRKLAAYTGHYKSDKWGTMDLRLENDTIVGNLGNIPVTLHAHEADNLVLSYPLGLETIEFKLKGKKVTEARIKSYAGYVMRFVKEN